MDCGHERDEFSRLAQLILGNRALAEKWLNAPSPLYGGLTPLAALASVEGRRRASRQLRWMARRPALHRPVSRI